MPVFLPVLIRGGSVLLTFHVFVNFRHGIRIQRRLISLNTSFPRSNVFSRVSWPIFENLSGHIFVKKQAKNYLIKKPQQNAVGTTVVSIL